MQKIYLTGLHPNDNKVKPAKMEALFTDLMAYADTLEPAHARNLKAELHSRSTQLSLDNVSNRADQVLGGTNTSHEGAMEMVKTLENALKVAKGNARVTKDVQKKAGALQEIVAVAKGKSSAAGHESINAVCLSDDEIQEGLSGDEIQEGDPKRRCAYQSPPKHLSNEDANLSICSPAEMGDNLDGVFLGGDMSSASDGEA